MLPSTIYTQFHGRMTKIGSPTNPNNANFVITYKGKDWSGFRTLQECIDQFAELEHKQNAHKDNFNVVER
jgi:hypothetical protein